MPVQIVYFLNSSVNRKLSLGYMTQSKPKIDKTLQKHQKAGL